MVQLLQQFQEKKNIYFVRHAESEFNKSGVIAGRLECPITQEGEHQATKTAEWFQDKHIEYILYSPQQRAKETAKIIQQKIHLHSINESCDDLQEIKAGIFESLTKEKAREKHAQLMPHFLHKSWEAIEKAETINELVQRAQRVWERISTILHTKDVHNILVVSHGGFIQWLFKTTYGFSGAHLETWSPLVPVLNCGIFHLTIEPAIDSNNTILGAHGTWKHINTIVY